MTQTFGSAWTIIKLDVVKQYLNAYFNVMKKQNFRLCYVDAFAGSGIIETQMGLSQGSALQALDYDFTQYYFFETNKEHKEELERNLQKHPQYEAKKDHIICKNEDCNNLFSTIHKNRWYQNNWRGIIFLDPYAMDLHWESLEKIKQTKAFDIWYLFPFSAVMRCLSKKSAPDPALSDTVSRVFGTTEWKEELYKEKSPVRQGILFQDPEHMPKVQTEERVNSTAVEEYIIKRMGQLFGSGFLKKPLRLLNSKNSTLFLLFFACCNESKQAQTLSHRIAGHLINKSG